MGIKTKLGILKRGCQGIWDNLFDKIMYPALQSETIGFSKEGREINCFRIGQGALKVLFIAGIHGNEVGTVKFANQLAKWAESDENIKKDFNFLIIPCLNPDGYNLAVNNPEYFQGGKTGRFNANKVDLNRNFNVSSFSSKSVWSSGKNYRDKTEVYCGDSGNSEPETRTLTELIISAKPAVIFSYHSCGSEVMGNNLPLSKELAKKYSSATGFRYVSEGDWQKLKQSGTLREWTESKKIPFIEVENPSRWGSDWKRQKIVIMKLMIWLGQRNTGL